MSIVDQVLEQGGGGFDLRVAIEGCPLEFCSTHAMAEVIADGSTEDLLNTGGVRRVGGLRRDGLSFQESAYLPGAEYRASLGSVTVEDTDESVAWNLRAASSVFSKVPQPLAYLALSVDYAETLWRVHSADGLTEGQVVHVDTEAVRIDAIAPGDGYDEITVTRSMYRTTSQGHFVTRSSIVGDRTVICPIFDAPPTYRGRRVWIYGHALSPSTGLPDSGSLLARGVVANAPTQQDGATWSFPLASLITLLDGEIGLRENTANLYGIYYPGASPYRITINRQAGPYRHGSAWDSRIVVYVAGFWRNNDEFCAALTTKIQTAAATAGWAETLWAAPTDSGTWELYVRTAPSPDEVYFSADGGNAIDGDFDSRGLYADTVRVAIVQPNEVYRFGWGDAADPRMGWPPPLDGVRRVPRSASYDHDLAPGTFDEIAAYPWHRVYASNMGGVQVGNVIRVDMPDLDTRAAFSWEAIVSEVDPDTGAITWSPDTMRRVDPGTGATIGAGGLWTEITPASMPTITIGGLRFGNESHVGELLLTVCDSARERANEGVLPFILTSDFDDFATIFARVEAAASGRPWKLHRLWSFHKPVRFADVIKHELRLLGGFLATTVTGAITIRPLVEDLTASHVLAADDLMTSDGFGDVIVEPEGILTGLTVRTGYDALEDEHKGQEYEITAVESLNWQRKRLALEIAPKSIPTGSEPDHDELISALYGTIALWSRHRTQVRVPVALWHYDALIGDVMSCTIPQLPYDGERSIDGGGGGFVNAIAVVTGRSWRFSEPSVELDLLFISLDRSVSRYAPAARVTSQTGSGTGWTLTLAPDEYGPGGLVSDASFFVVGFAVRVIEWNADAPSIVTGTVSAVSGNDISVIFDSAWTPGTATWNLHYAESTASGIVEDQLDFAFIARASRRVQLASGTRGPSLFTP